MMPRRDSTEGVIPFPVRDPVTDSARPRTPGRVIELEAYRKALREEHGAEEWDRLARLGEEAWTWRDPESLEALESCVARLKAAVVREWETT